MKQNLRMRIEFLSKFKKIYLTIASNLFKEARSFRVVVQLKTNEEFCRKQKEEGNSYECAHKDDENHFRAPAADPPVSADGHILTYRPQREHAVLREGALGH